MYQLGKKPRGVPKDDEFVVVSLLVCQRLKDSSETGVADSLEFFRVVMLKRHW